MKRADAIHTQYVIVGAGPSGLQLGYFLQRTGREYVILEASDQSGAFFTKYPRRRELISFNKAHSIYDDPEIRLRWDWNSLLTDDYGFAFPPYSKRIYPTADELLRYLNDFASGYDLRIEYASSVTKIYRAPDGTFRLRVKGRSDRTCDVLVIATGAATPFVPQVPGIEHAEGYESLSLAAGSYEDQRVLILGKGNSGFEVADALVDSASLIHLASPRPLQFAWKTRHPGHVRGQYSRILDMYQLKTLHGVLDAHVKSIKRDENGSYAVRIAYVHADGEEEELVYDRVLRCTGFRFDNSIFDASCLPSMTLGDRLPAMTSAWESTNVPQMYFVGTLMQSRDFKSASSAFIDGFRYNIRTLARILEHRVHGAPLASRRIDSSAAGLTDAVSRRICRSSALWAQFGYLCDVIAVDPDSKEAAYYEELPRDFVVDGGVPHLDDYYVITFEWGSWAGDVFAIDRHPSHEMAYTNAFLHPVIRRFKASQQVEEHHVLEDLFGTYRPDAESGVVRMRSGRSISQYHHEEHIAPLLNFFERS